MEAFLITKVVIINKKFCEQIKRLERHCLVSFYLKGYWVVVPFQSKMTGDVLVDRTKPDHYATVQIKPFGQSDSEKLNVTRKYN